MHERTHQQECVLRPLDLLAASRDECLCILPLPKVGGGHGAALSKTPVWPSCGVSPALTRATASPHQGHVQIHRLARARREGGDGVYSRVSVPSPPMLRG